MSLSSMTLYREQGRPLQQECVHTTRFSAGSGCRECISFLFFFLSQMCFYDFYSNDLVLDHVIKLFIVLYRALKHGDLGWMLCVCLDCGVIIIIF